MGVEQVVEELHVQLIVLDDQNGLGLGVHDLTLRRARAQFANIPKRGPG